MARSHLTLVIAFFFPTVGTAHAQGVVRPGLDIPRVTSVPVLEDFVGMEASDAPRGMRKVEGLVQRFPNDGAPISERTVVYVGYDRDNIYVVFQCFDRQPEHIGAHVVGRDLLPNDDDSVAVHFDTFHDLKHAYGFQVNPLGVQTEGIYTEGSGWDLSWDTKWHSAARITTTGYVVLIGIPFRSLRFPASDAQRWGMFFYRAIARRNEQAYWPACSTRYSARFPQAAIASGVHDVSPGRNVQAIPYVASRSFRTMDLGGGRASLVSKRLDGSIGVDAKVVVKDAVVLDATLNPDFSQVESDQPQITVNRPFEVFFPEKRPFFLENATYFNTPIQLLFTRRVADPLFGGRATGRIGAYSIGTMIVDDRSPFDAGATEPAWYGVGRVFRDIGRESFVGGFVSNRARGGYTNRVIAADGRMKLGTNWFASGQAASSDTSGPTRNVGRGSAIVASLVGSGRRFNYEAHYNDRSPTFRAVDGFIPRVDLRSVDQIYSFRSRPAAGALQAWGPDIVVNRTWDREGHPLDWAVTPRLGFQWPGTTLLNLYYTAAHQALRPTEVPTVRRVVDTRVNRSGFEFQSAILPRLVGSGTAFVGDATNLTPAVPEEFSPGRIAGATANASIRISRSVMLDVSHLVDRLRDARSRLVVYSNNITRVRVGQYFTRALAWRAIVQYNQLAVDPSATTLEPGRNLNYDLLLTYLTTPGTALYVGANYNLANVDTRFGAPADAVLPRTSTLNNTGWQVFTKMSYLFRR